MDKVLFILTTIFMCTIGTTEWEEQYYGIQGQSPRITKHSHFSQKFKLGYKLQLMCEGEGYPRPSIVWYKNGAEINQYKTLQMIEKILSPIKLRSKLEIDPTSISDRGVYACVSSNSNGYHMKSMKAEYVL